MRCIHSNRLVPSTRSARTANTDTRKRELITDTAGAAVAELSMAPPLYVSRTLGAQRKARPLPVAQRAGRAGPRPPRSSPNGVIAGLDFEAYVVAGQPDFGLPIAVTRAGARGVADAVAVALSMRCGRLSPSGAALDWRDERTRAGGAVWARRGEVFAVHAAGNGPGVHGLWPQALALGYRVAVRPSRREPLTAHRLVHARCARPDFAPQDAVYLPTDHARGRRNHPLRRTSPWCTAARTWSTNTPTIRRCS